MITILICAILFLCFGILLLKQDREKIIQNGTAISFLFMCLCIGVLFGLLIAIALPEKKHYVKTTYIIENLQDNSNIQGRFFLGSGQVGEKMVYSFYYNDNGRIKLEQINSSFASIYYYKGTPKIVRYEQKKIKGVLINYFAIDAAASYCYKYEILIPKGTIKQNYNLDAQ